MPKLKQLEQCKHPNSRKTKALAKSMKRQSLKEKIKTATYIKQNLLGEKLLWFRDHLEPNLSCVTPATVAQLIQGYLERFNEELEQIQLKHSVGQRKNRQHASREDVIKMTLKREKEEFQTCGIEMPDLLNQGQLVMLKSWNGELRYLQNFKLKRFSVSSLQQVDGGNKNR